MRPGVLVHIVSTRLLEDVSEASTTNVPGREVSLGGSLALSTTCIDSLPTTCVRCCSWDTRPAS